MVTVSIIFILAAFFISFAIVAFAYLSAEADKHEADTQVEIEKLRMAAAAEQAKVSAKMQKKAVEEYNKEDNTTGTFLQALANIDKVWEEANK